MLIRTLPVLLLVMAGTAAPQDQMQRPAPELQKLNYFAGTWKTEATMKANAYSPGGTYTSIDHFEWQKGSFFLVGHTDFTSPTGGGVELMIMGWDPAHSAYSYNSFNSAGEHEIATGRLSGDTFTWTSDQSAPFKWRYIEKMSTPSSYSVKFEGSQDGSTWSTILEGASTKQ
jgi:hypothetical protein